MSLGLDLTQAGVQWAIDIVTQKRESERFPGKFYPVEKLRVRLADMTLAKQSGLEPVTHEFLTTCDSSFTVERLLAAALRKFMSTHPVYEDYCQSKGRQYVKIDAFWLGDGLGEALHTALRKSVYGPHSCIQHRAIQHLANCDWSALLEEARKEIGKQIALVKEGRRVALNRYTVGMAIRKAFMDEDGVVRISSTADGRGGFSFKRREAVADFALLALTNACKETDPQDFVWGWTDLLCEPLSPQEEAAAHKRFERLQKTLQTKGDAKVQIESKPAAKSKRPAAAR